MDSPVAPGGRVPKEPTAGSRSYSCTTCTRSFTRLENLKRHMKTHERILPFSCQLCGRRFSRSDLANKHQLRHLRRDPLDLLTSRINNNPKCHSQISKPQCHLTTNKKAYSASGQKSAGHRPEIGCGIDGLCDQAYHDASPLAQTVARVDGDVANPLDLCVDFSEKSGIMDAALILEDHEVMSQMIIDKKRNETQNARCHDQKDISNVTSCEQYDAPTCSTGMSFTSEAEISSHALMDENELAYAWDPSSEDVIHQHCIVLEDNNPLALNHNTRFDMNEATWCRIKRFLEPRDQVQDDFTLPSLAVANVFIGLFFESFYEQSPVLHLPTLNINSLTSSLLVVMMTIGAKYSKLQHTRHFAILVLDRSRQNLQYDIERDDSLVRQDQIIYALSLMCYSGLWSGNKRAYGIAEGTCGTLVAYTRRLQRQEADMPNDMPEDYEEQWMKWIGLEYRRRLLWFVFMIDAQLPALLKTRSVMSLAEIARWACPGDDEFWFAPSARTWKSLLGSAVVPPAPKFAMVSSTIFDHLERSLDTYATSMSMPRLNQWSSFLALLSLASRALEWSHEWAFAIEMTLETTGEDDPFNFSVKNLNTHMRELMRSRQRLLSAFDTWEHLYGPFQSPHPGRPQTGSYFQRASRILHNIAKLYLSVSILDIKDALGKGGRAKLDSAMYRFRILSVCGYVSETGEDGSPDINANRTVGFSHVSAIFQNAIEEIIAISSDAHLQSAFPYSYMSIFLHHVLLWVLARTGTQDIRRTLGENLDENLDCPMELRERELKDVVQFALSGGDATNAEPKAGVILKHGAKVLTGLETWGAALNLALLMQWRSNA